MKSSIHVISLTIIFCFCLNYAFSQEHKESKEAFRPEHLPSVVISHVQVFQARGKDGNKKVLSLPSCGLDYTFQFKPKWGMGLHIDIITEPFEVEKHLVSGSNGKVIERSYPIAPPL